MQSVPLVLRLIIYGVAGFLIGNYLGRCAAQAQVLQHEKVQINSNNVVVLRDEVSSDTVQAAQFELALLAFKRGFQNYPIYLVLDSPGGDVDAGISFIEFAKTIPNVRTITIFAASMAADIVEGLPGSRLITNNGELMFHRAKGAFQGQFEVGEVESRLEMAKKMVSGLEIQNANRMHISLLEYKGRAMNEWWLNSEDSMKAHASDKIVDIVCSTELTASRIKDSINTMFGPVAVVYSGCPLFRYPLATDTVESLFSTAKKKVAKRSQKK